MKAAPIAPWDANFLRQREVNARANREDAQFDRDYALSAGLYLWDISDAAGGHRICPLKVCRRARGCRSGLQSCAAMHEIDLATPAARDAIDDIYASMQQDRMQQALGSERNKLLD